MSDYIDIVLARKVNPSLIGPNQLYVWRAPRFSSFKEGDLLLVETPTGDQRVIVESSATIGLEDDELQVILKLTEHETIETVDRVLGVYRYTPVKWEDEE